MKSWHQCKKTVGLQSRRDSGPNSSGCSAKHFIRGQNLQVATLSTVVKVRNDNPKQIFTGSSGCRTQLFTRGQSINNDKIRLNSAASFYYTM
jgi:hypothetical protein